MDIHSRSKSLVLAARRPLSYFELSSAIGGSHSRDDILGDVLEVSGGLRPIVQFKEMTALGGDAKDHEVAARACLRVFNVGYRRLDQNAFLQYAIEFVMKHADGAGPDMHADFMAQFDYQTWQLWAVQLPVYAALDTYSFGGAMRRLKCFHLLTYVAEHDSSKLSTGVRSSRFSDTAFRYNLSPWRGGTFESRQIQRQQQRDLLLGVGSSRWPGRDDSPPDTARVNRSRFGSRLSDVIRDDDLATRRDEVRKALQVIRDEDFASSRDELLRALQSDARSRASMMRDRPGAYFTTTAQFDSSSRGLPTRESNASSSRSPLRTTLVSQSGPSTTMSSETTASPPTTTAAPPEPISPAQSSFSFEDAVADHSKINLSGFEATPAVPLEDLVETHSEAGMRDLEATPSFSFEDIVGPPSEAGLSDFEMLDLEIDDEDLPWEDIEYQEAILASLQQTGEGRVS